MGSLGRGINNLEGLVACLEMRSLFHRENGLRESPLLPEVSILLFMYHGT